MPTKREFPFSGHFLQGFLFQETQGAFQPSSGENVPGNSGNSGTGGETPGPRACPSLTCLTAVLTSPGWGLSQSRLASSPFYLVSWLSHL